jgi:hypothetical protein
MATSAEARAVLLDAVVANANAAAEAASDSMAETASAFGAAACSLASGARALAEVID